MSHFLENLEGRAPHPERERAAAAQGRRRAAAPSTSPTHLKKIGMTRARGGDARPGTRSCTPSGSGAPGKPTALLYGHYDVQPVEPLELWKTPPFEPTERDGKLYARGACDDKGQVYMHLSAIEAHLAVNKKLPINLKLVIEGEEEAGSDSLEGFLRRPAQGARRRRHRGERHRHARRPTSPRSRTRCAASSTRRSSVTGPDARPALGRVRRRGDEPRERARRRSSPRCAGRRRPHHRARLLRQRCARVVAARDARRTRRCRSTRRASSPRPAPPMAYGEKGRSTLERIWSRPDAAT